MVMPCTPLALRAFLTSSSLKCRITASIFFTGILLEQKGCFCWVNCDCCRQCADCLFSDAIEPRPTYVGRDLSQSLAAEDRRTAATVLIVRRPVSTLGLNSWLHG